MAEKTKAPEPVTTALQEIAIPQDTQLMGFQDAFGVRGAYLSFPMSRSKRWEAFRLEHADLREYEPVLVVQRAIGEEILRVGKDMCFRCWYIAGAHCYAHLDIGSGAVIAAAKEHPEPENPKSNFTERVEAVIVLMTEKGLMPCRASFVRAMSSCGMAMDQARTHPDSGVTSKAWAEKNPETMKVPPQYRFTVRVGPITVRPSRRSPGYNYPTAGAKITPSTPAECKEFLAAQETKEFQNMLRGCIAQYVERINEIKGKMISTAKAA